LSPAVHVAERSYTVPYPATDGYVDELITICKTEGVRLVVPTFEDDLAVLGAAFEAFDAIDVVVACSSEATSVLCNDTYATCARLTEAGVPAARSYVPAQLHEDLPLPLFVRPRHSRGGDSGFIARTQDELDFFLHYIEAPIVQECLGGPEYILDVLCDFDGRPLSIVPRERVVIREGVFECGRTVSDKRLIALAETVCEAITFAGPISIRCRMRHDQPAVFEINPRISDGVPLTIQSGADFTEMLVRLAAGRKVPPAIGQYRPDLWMTSFESSFFLDGETMGLTPMSPSAGIGEVA
jgi:carbamoyl-phosphate synthase large subunit